MSAPGAGSRTRGVRTRRRPVGVVGGLLAAALLLLPACSPREIDGSGNHPAFPELGAAGTALRRALESDYADGYAALAGSDRPSPRSISNRVHAQRASAPNALGASAFVWQWGQFVDHDIDLTPEGDEPAPIPVPPGDAWFDPLGRGDVEIDFHRSAYLPGSGEPSRPRAPRNAITTWLDASMVYGSDAVRARALRAKDGSGRLATSAGNLLPFNEAGLPNAGGTDPDLFLAGDERANEQVGLTALHTLFVREHNRLARRIARARPDLRGGAIYRAARAVVEAEIQVITFEEYLPLLLGRGALPPYRGYDPGVDPRIANVFSAAAFRLGHSQLNPFLLRLDARGREHEAGHLPLRHAFFAPEELALPGGLEAILRGLAAQRAQAVDVYVIDDVRNFLFGPPGAGGFDLASANIQRGRDHGLPSYNAAREGYGLPPAADYADVSSDPEVRARLEAAYGRGNVDDVDLWVGALAEDRVPGALVGPLVRAVVAQQFAALRDGDRYWHARRLPPLVRAAVSRLRLSDVIRRNTAIGRELPRDVFRVRRRLREASRVR